MMHQINHTFCFLLLLLVWTAVVNTSSGSRHAIKGHSLKTDEANKKLGVETIEVCDQDYFPCSCSFDIDNNTLVVCSNVSVQSVRDAFQRVDDPEIYSLELTPLIADADNTVSLPADFLGNTRVTSEVYIDCGGTDTITKYPNLIIDPLAFRSSKNSATAFTIDYCDLGLQTDFNFFNGFDKLESLHIFNTNNVNAFQNMPPLPSLRDLSFRQCSGFNEIAFPDLNPAKLKTLFFYKCSINDQTSDAIMASLAASTSADSLSWLSLNANSMMTRIPNQVGSSFPQLSALALGTNDISRISSSSLAFTSPSLVELNMAGNNLKTIESDAFQGNFTATRFSLFNNGLTVFEEGVFKEMIQQMMSVGPSPIGFVAINLNPMSCGCDIAWLIRDNRDLLPAIRGGRCAIDSPFPSVAFENLNPESFANC